MPNVHVLLGNHEYMMLRALGEPFEPDDDRSRIEEYRFHWYRNGGNVTHNYWKRIRKTLRAEVLDYLKALPLNFSVRVGDRTFRLVHGSLPENFDTENGKYKTHVHYAVWKRLEKGDRPAAGETVVFGHTPVKYYQSTNPLRIYHGDGIIGNSLHGADAAHHRHAGSTVRGMKNAADRMVNDAKGAAKRAGESVKRAADDAMNEQSTGNTNANADRSGSIIGWIVAVLIILAIALIVLAMLPKKNRNRR